MSELNLFEGTDATLIMSKNDETNVATIYLDTTEYGQRIPLYICSDRELAFIFGFIDQPSYSAMSLTEEDTQAVIDEILKDGSSEFKPNAVMHSSLTVSYNADDKNMILQFYVYYHLWIKSDTYMDMKSEKLGFRYVLNYSDYIKDLIYLNVKNNDNAAKALADSI